MVIIYIPKVWCCILSILPDWCKESIWFVNKKPKKEAGAGTAPYMFKTNDAGEGSYSAPLGESPFGKWQMIMIVLHPDGDPGDMKNLVGALKASL